jgi:hypothetical protein
MVSAFLTDNRKQSSLTNPNSVQIESYSISGNPLMISGTEDEILPIPIGEPFPQLYDSFLEFLRHQNLMRQGGEGEVKVVREFRMRQMIRLSTTPSKFWISQP